ncbi:NTP transferase domain-containing protein [Chloroflexi bacterium TSY]|nr:NTP transferase domain-containing protein [Chloroflexi bacterium TSY]
MKALILAGGYGSRFSSSLAAHLGEPETPVHKCLTQIGHRRVVDFSLDIAVELDVDEIILVVGYLAETVKAACGSQYRGVPITYAYQPEQQGLVHAMMCGRDALGEDDFWLFLGDEVLIDANHKAMQERFYKDEAFLICGMIPTDDPDRIRRNYTLAFDDESSRVWRLVEKPVRPFTPYIGTGHCVFRNKILHYMDLMPNDPRTGNKELAGLIQYAIDVGESVLCHSFDETFYYVNINTYEEYLGLEAALMGETIN